MYPLRLILLITVIALASCSTMSDDCCNNKIEIIPTRFYHNQVAFYVPQVFVPDGDGLLDVFKVRGHGWTARHFEVCSAWGSVYESSSKFEWDGKNGGAMCGDGKYSFVLQVTTMHGEELEINGKICLMSEEVDRETYCNCTNDAMIDDEHGFIYPGDSECGTD